MAYNMEVKIDIGKLSENITLKSIENVTHTQIPEEELRKYFSFLKENSLINADNFDESVWLIYNENKDREIIFKFDLEMYQELNKALKGYILLKRMTGTAINTCHKILMTLKRVILKTSKFEDLKELEIFLMSQTSIVGFETAGIIRLFLTFYEHPLSSEIIDICNSIKTQEKKNRELPYFPDVIAFDEIIEEFFSSYNSEEYFRFYPILIWWKLTNVLPMRVIEVLKLKKKMYR